MEVSAQSFARGDVDRIETRAWVERFKVRLGGSSRPVAVFKVLVMKDGDPVLGARVR